MNAKHVGSCSIRIYCPTTGEWLIKRAEFEEWKRTQNLLLWLYGIHQFALVLFLFIKAFGEKSPIVVYTFTKTSDDSRICIPNLRTSL